MLYWLRQSFRQSSSWASFHILEALDIDGKEVELIKSLYWDQQAAVRQNGALSDFVIIRQGVRQGCVLPPELFNLYTETIMRHLKDQDGLSVGGVNINSLRYADDTAILADSEEEL